MVLIRTISRNIRNGIRAVWSMSATVAGAATGHDTIGNVNEYDQDIEMGLLTALSTGPNRNNNVLLPLPESDARATTRRPHLGGLSTIVCRPAVLREIGEVARMCVILTFVLIAVFFWPTLGDPLRWILAPIGVSTGDMTVHNLNVLRDMGSQHGTYHVKPTNITTTEPTYATGFYFLPVAAALPDVFTKPSLATSFPPSSAAESKELSTTAAKELATTSGHFHTRHNKISESLFHSAYPVRAGAHTADGIRETIRTDLQSCADVLQARVKNGQVLEWNADLQYLLQHCKQSVDQALNTFFPPARAEPDHPPVPLHEAKRALAPDDDFVAVASQIHTIVSNNTKQVDPASAPLVPLECDWHRPYSHLTARSCSDNFCDWVSPTSLDRCYHRNTTDFKKNGKISYLNESVDDFKVEAPLECNLCLPSQDCEGIDAHCIGVEFAKGHWLRNWLLLACGLFSTALCAGFASHYYKKYRAEQTFHRPHYGNNVAQVDGEGTELEDRSRRIPVMPPAVFLMPPTDLSDRVRIRPLAEE